MKQILYYYYNVYFDIEKENDYESILRYNNDLYLFKRLDIEQDLLDENIKILNNYHIRYHNIVLNHKRVPISTYKNKNYVLLKIDYSLKDKWYDFQGLEYDFHNIAIADIWTKRLDYYADLLHCKNNKDLLFLSVFNYYSGLSENAIQIANRLKNNNVNLKRVLAHKRVEYPFNYLKYYDPTEMIIDYRIRDYSEYLKNKVFKEDINVDKEYRYILKSNYSNEEVNILIARLLYPSYYFDRLDEYMEDIIDMNELLKIIDLIPRYEKFLKELLSRMNIDYNIYQIEWLKK